MHEIFFENLRNPARIRRVGLMREFRSGQLDSSTVELIKTKLAHHTRAAVARGIS